jgi:hypothetical protein
MKRWSALNTAEDTYDRLRILVGDEYADRVGRLVTGATLQLHWRRGTVEDPRGEYDWPCHEGDVALGWLARNLRAPRLWPRGHVYSADAAELTTLHDNLRRRYGDAARLAVGFRASAHDSTAHIGVLRSGQELYKTPSGRLEVIARDGPEPGETTFGVALDQGDKRTLLPVDTSMVEQQIVVAHFIAEGHGVVPVV